MPEDEEIALFRDAHFGTIANNYISLYVIGDRSIDSVLD